MLIRSARTALACAALTVTHCAASPGQTAYQEPPAPLVNAQRLADAGKWSQAETAVRNYLQTQKNSADARYLLGYILFKENKPKNSLAQYATGARDRPPGALDLEAIGSDYFLLEDYANADKWLSQALKQDPASTSVLYLLGRAKYNERHFAQAAQVFAKCLSLNPGNLKAQEYLGRSYEQLGNTKQAIRAYRVAVSLAKSTGSKDAGPYLDLGSMLVEQNQAAESVPYLIQAIRLQSRNAKAHRKLGKADLQLNQFEKARAELEKAVQLNPQNAPTHFLLAETYRKLGLSSKAQEQIARYRALSGTHSAPADPLSEARSLVESGKFDAAGQIVDRYLQVHKNSADAHYLRGYIYFKQQRPKRSLAEYTEGARYRTPSAVNLEAVGADYVLLRDFVDADKWFSVAAKWDPGDFEILYYLGRTKYNENRFAEAISAFTRCLELRPQSVKAEDNLGLAYEGLGRMKDAKTAFETAILWESADPKDSGPYIDLGGLFVDSDQASEAVTYLLQALKISPRSLRAHRELGKAYMHAGDFSKARMELETSAGLAPNNAPIHFMLAQAYEKLGLKDKARQEIERYKALSGTRSTAK